VQLLKKVLFFIVAVATLPSNVVTTQSTYLAIYLAETFKLLYFTLRPLDRSGFTRCAARRAAGMHSSSSLSALVLDAGSDLSWKVEPLNVSVRRERSVSSDGGPSSQRRSTRDCRFS
jgi:hypothetical protein